MAFNIHPRTIFTWLVAAALTIAVVTMLKRQENVKAVPPQKPIVDNAWVAPEINADTSLAPETKICSCMGSNLLPTQSNILAPRVWLAIPQMG